jgi:Uma2 family endonuclease
MITPEDLLRMQDNQTLELVDGKIREKEVSQTSSRVGARIIRLLGAVSDQSSEAEIYGSDLGYECFPDDPNRIRKPDVSLIRRDRLKNLKGDHGFMPIPPDLAVEVLSPNDTTHEIGRKIREYRAADFNLIWIVDPELRTVTIYRPEGPITVLQENDDITGETALPTFRCRVGEFFAQ